MNHSIVEKDLTIPILLCTYNRADHLRIVLKSLINQEEFSRFKLIIFWDGSKILKLKDKDLYERMSLIFIEFSSYIHILHESNDNVGPANGYRFLTEHYGLKSEAFVYLEDDVFLHPNWSSIMLSSFDKRKELGQRILSISAFNLILGKNTPPKRQSYFLSNYNGWGSIILTEEYIKVNEFNWKYWKNSGYLYLTNFIFMFKLLRNSPHLFSQVLYNFSNGIFYGDALISFYCYFSNVSNYYLGEPLITNIGFDGSGLNCPDVNSKDISINDVVLQVGLFTKTIAILRYFFILLFWNYIKVKDIQEVNYSVLNLFRRNEYTSL